MDVGLVLKCQTCVICLQSQVYSCFVVDLFLPLRLYVMAHKFDVPALKLLARDRFFYAAELCWMNNESFPAVVDELYTTTSDTDVSMREIVYRLVGPNMLRHEHSARLEEVMRKHGDFAAAVMNHMPETQCL